MRILGVDLAMNHSGWVCLDESGKLLDFVALTDRKASVKARPDHVWHVPKVKEPDNAPPEQADLRRMYRMQPVIEALLERFNPSHVGLEDYAYSRTGGHSKGEFGGMFRLMVYASGIRLRVHEPKSVKLFTTGNGDAEKIDMVNAAVRIDGFDFRNATDGSKQSICVAEDLADAWALAKMVQIELLLRAGKMSLSDLTEAQISVVNRVTKSRPVALLQQDWTWSMFNSGSAGVLRMDADIRHIVNHISRACPV